MPDPEGGGGGEFISMEPYLEPGPAATLVASMYRSRLLRKRIWEMAPTSAYRRTNVLRFFAWCYRRFNDGRRIPYAVFAPDFKLTQTAAMIDTAGNFVGRDGLDRVREELAAAFADFRFEPTSAVDLGPDRILFMVRFWASGRGSGLELERPVGHLFSIKDGNAASLDVYWEESEALEAAGLNRSRAPS